MRIQTKYNIPSFKKGGMVDYSGIAQLHGSKSSPEAVLTSEQTQMFITLRDVLSKFSFEGKDSGSSIQIDNITIQTQSMDTNQDFNKAGKVLAEAFNSAITRRGINLNTKK